MGSTIRDDLRTVPNIITLSRIVLLWLGVLVYFYVSHGVGIALAILAGVTDYLDGYIARRTKQVTRLGEILDQFCDLCFESFIIVITTLQGYFPPYVIFLYLLREFWVTGIRRFMAEARINIRWVTIANSGPFGVMKFLVTDPDRAHEVLKHDGVMASFLDVIPVEVADRPGALQAVAECLAKDNINLDNTSGFVANQRAVVIVETHDLERARALLVGQGLRVLSREELLDL